MKTSSKKNNYLEQKRQIILALGYDYIRFKSHSRKSLKSIKRLIQNNASHFEDAQNTYLFHRNEKTSKNDIS